MDVPTLNPLLPPPTLTLITILQFCFFFFFQVNLGNYSKKAALVCLAY